MLNIDRLKYYWDQPFLDLMAGMERKIRHNDPDIVFGIKIKHIISKKLEQLVNFGVIILMYGCFFMKTTQQTLLKYN